MDESWHGAHRRCAAARAAIMRETPTTTEPACRSSWPQPATTLAARASRSMSLIIFIIFVALVFDFLNGFHDAANSIATVVSTRVLTPTQAVVVGGVFQLRRGVPLRHRASPDDRQGLDPHPQFVDIYVVFGGLMARSSGTSSPGCSRCRPARRTRWSAALAGRGDRQGRIRRRSSSARSGVCCCCSSFSRR